MEAPIRKWATENDVAEKDFEKLCAEPKVKKAVLDSLLATGKEAGLKGSEFLHDIHIIHEEWTVDNVSDYI